MKIKSSKPELPEPDMTPMIDCVFQLITFFMVVINFENTQADERVKLPDSELAKPPKVKLEEELVLNVGFIRNSDGSRRVQEPLVFYPGKDTPIKDMGPILKKEKDIYRLRHPKGPIKATVVIRADGEVPTGQIQELIKLCQAQEFEKFVLKALEKMEQ
jgi:biopolymer transport protein ExbD